MGMNVHRGKSIGGDGMLKEFKEFAVKGNVIDLAIGVILGGAFGKIVASLVEDIIMPVVGSLVGKVDFGSLSISLRGVALNYGLFLNTIIEFTIIAFSLFLVIRQINKLKREEIVEPVTTKKCKYCLSEIPLEASRCPNCTSVLEGVV